MKNDMQPLRFLALLLATGLFLTGCSSTQAPATPSMVEVQTASLPPSSAASAPPSQPSSSASSASSQPRSSASSASSQSSSSPPNGSASASPASSALVVAAAAGSRDATPYVRVPTASGTTQLGSGTVDIDASNTSEGYVMVRYNGSNGLVKMQLTPDGGTTYTYDLHARGSYETFPLVAGSTGYTLNVFENVYGDQFAQICGTYFQVTLQSGLLPFLYPNQFVDFSSNSSTVSLGSQLATGAANDLGVVDAVYNWTISHIGYDFDKAAAAASGSIPFYLPNVDSTISTGKGICFDYAAVMVAMLRSQRIPTKLVIGYAGQIYHAWISVYITDVGWVNDTIQFNGSSWVRMDPTFASSGNSSKDIMQYIGNGNNYQALLVY